MPKGQVPEREVICRACKSTFLTTRVGKAAFYCHRPRCDAERAARPTPPRERRETAAKPSARPGVTVELPTELEAARQRRIRQEKEREAREAAEREENRRRRIEAQRREAQQRRAALNLRQRHTEERMAERQRELFDPIRDDYKSMLLLDEFMETIMRATELEGTQVEVKKAIVKLTHAVGVEGRWDAAIDLAAAAMALAGGLPHHTRSS